MDIDAIKSRLNQLQNTTSNSFWKPQPGKSQVRIVPYTHDKNNPFSELFFHYSLVPNKTVLSPLSFGRPDPVQQFADKLKSSGNKDEWIQGKRIEPKMRTFVPVIARGEENDGVKFWGFGKTVYQELLSIIADPDYGDITDPVNGRDVTVEFKTAEETGASFPSTSIRVKPNQTSVTDDTAVLKKIKETQKDIREIYIEMSYDELTDILNEWLTPTEDSGQNSSTEKKETVSKETKKTVAPTTDSTAAFDELFNS